MLCCVCLMHWVSTEVPLPVLSLSLMLSRNVCEDNIGQVSGYLQLGGATFIHNTNITIFFHLNFYCSQNHSAVVN